MITVDDLSLPGTGTSGSTQIRTHRTWLAVPLVGLVAVLFVVAILGLPDGSTPLPAIAREALDVAIPQWRTTEPVSEVVYGTRGADTFGETFLLLAAVVSVVLLTRHREARQGFVGETAAGAKEQRSEDPEEGADTGQQEARAADEAESDQETDSEDEQRPRTPDAEPLGAPSPDPAESMTVVVRVAVRIVAPLLAVAGFYLVAQGYSPGGGFPAGAVLFGVLLLVYAAFGRRRVERIIAPRLVELVELAGAMAIILTEVFGLVLRGSFSANWIPLGPLETLRSGGVLQAFSVAEFFEVGTGLTLVVFSLISMRHDWTPDEDEQ